MITWSRIGRSPGLECRSYNASPDPGAAALIILCIYRGSETLQVHHQATQAIQSILCCAYITTLLVIFFSGQKGFIVGFKGTTIYRIWIPTGYGFGKVIESSSIRFDSTDLYENEAQKLQEDGVLDFNDGYSLKLSNGRASLSTSSELGGERTSDSDVEDEEPDERSYTHTD